MDAIPLVEFLRTQLIADTEVVQSLGAFSALRGRFEKIYCFHEILLMGESYLAQVVLGQLASEVSSLLIVLFGFLNTFLRQFMDSI